MIDVIVQRGVGDIQGDDIIDPLIVTTSVAIIRGSMEVDEHRSYVDVKLTAMHVPEMKPGVLVEVLDSISGTFWVGKVRSVEISFDGESFVDTLTIKRPL